MEGGAPCVLSKPEYAVIKKWKSAWMFQVLSHGRVAVYTTKERNLRKLCSESTGQTDSSS